MIDVERYRRVAESTYKTYNEQELKKEAFVSGGFVYTNTADRVKCSYCELSLEDWVSSDNPLEEHESRSPNCPFIVALKNKLHSIASYGSVEKDGPSTQPWTLEERQRTFHNYPEGMPVAAGDLAEAGFYYVGEGDKVLCAHCGVGCHEWEPLDNPWLEHRKFSPDCTFLKSGPSIEYLQSLDIPKPKSSDDVVHLPCQCLERSYVDGRTCSKCGAEAVQTIPVHLS